MKEIGRKGGIGPTHSQTRNQIGVSGQGRAEAAL
jgi:hypothetical protein